MNLFLEGERGIGKTSMILQSLKKFSGKTRGFISVRLLSDEGETVAFGLENVRNVKNSVQPMRESRIPQEHIFLKGNQETKEVHLEVFEHMDDLMEDCRQADLIVMDELGGVELQADKFREHLYELLQMGVPCIGTIKSQQNYQQMTRHVTLPEKDKEAQRFRTWLLHQPDSQILTCTRENLGEIQQKLECFLKQCKIKNKPFIE